MRPADDPAVDYKAFVQRAYDRCAGAYDESRENEAHPELELLQERLKDGASVLDIGCGSGVPVSRSLAERLAVTGVDISREMVQRAQVNVPAARFIQADITTAEFEASSFDAVVAFYSIFHIPREEHHALFSRIRDWLRPGGLLMCTLSYYNEPAYTEDDFFGETMYWSNYGLAEYTDMLSGLGFIPMRTSIVGHGYFEDPDVPSEQHPLVFARKA